MSRNKKSRTAGNSEPRFDGSRKETSTQAQMARDKKRKDKLKGNKAGNRNAIETKQGAQQSQRQAKNDKRIGSKKPVALVVNEKPQQAAKPKVLMQPKAKVIKTTAIEPKTAVAEAPTVQKLSPEKEIAAIENDQRLNDLLEQMETDVPLTKEEQKWADKQMQRHQELMKELGWLDDEGEEDLLQQFEDASSALDEFR
ncbi:Der GTPase-activating protein YihI [Psychromonas algicola]|uniref:Der GTPase-activating protein YihI n=1 Tax=Psychromonas algicola TaxID=2555642 RepID=UPI001068215E|nr:Der GTPase-activating protein YihI [Psychromonas sp. RZ5]TEW52769.1 GTPase-activating protein [Psychromonas sp. RZ5]